MVKTGRGGESPGEMGGKWCRYNRAVGEMLLQRGDGSAAAGTRTHNRRQHGSRAAPSAMVSSPRNGGPGPGSRADQWASPAPLGASMGSSRHRYCGEAKLIPSMHPHSHKRAMRRSGSAGSLSMHHQVTSKPPSRVTLHDGPKSGQGVEGAGGGAERGEGERKWIPYRHGWG